MIRYIVLLCISTLYLFALSDTEMLQRADKFMSTSNKSDQFRAYNDYKNLYLRSMMSDDLKLKRKALKGIVKSGKKLHIDILKYEKELKTLEKSASSYKKEKLNTQNSAKTKQTIKVKNSHKLKSVKWQDEKLVLHFDTKLKSKQLNYFTSYDSKRKKYKYIFDIHASMLTSSKNLRKKGVDRVQLAQFNPTTLRLVFENSKKLSVRYKYDNNDVIITVNNTNIKGTSVTKKPKTVNTPKRLDRNKVIVLDPGHGGRDPGAVGHKKYREKIVVMQIAKELKTILKSRGYKVYMTRDNDKYVKLSKRTKLANKKNADIFISIHANAVPKKSANKAYGVECYFLSKSRTEKAKRVAAKENSVDMSDMNFYGKKSFLNTLSSHNIVASNKLAIDLQRGMLGGLKKHYTKVKDGGVREGPFWVLVGAQMPSVLVEVGFITHPREAARLVSTKYQKRLALGLANGVERYFLNN